MDTHPTNGDAIMLAYDYPTLGIFWTMLMLFLWFAWLMLLFRVILDIVRSRDMGGVAKALWALLVIVIPWLGVLAYLLVRGPSMYSREVARAEAQQDALDAYIRETAGGGRSAADELLKLSDLRDRGVLSDAEFAAQKAKILA